MIRVMTEHHGERTFPDDHVPEILEAATLHIVDGAGKTVLLVADGEWRTVEIGAESPLPLTPEHLGNEAYPPERLDAIAAVLYPEDGRVDLRPAGKYQAVIYHLYDAAVGRA